MTTSSSEGAPPDPTKVAEQRALLQVHRDRLTIRLHQLAMYGMLSVPPDVILDIAYIRREIRRIKALLRSWNQLVPDEPGDEDEPSNATILVASSGFDALRMLMHDPDVLSTVKIFQNDFQKVRKLIGMMIVYKRLHDAFQQLESSYRTIHTSVYEVDGRPLPDERLRWKILETIKEDFNGHAGWLLDEATRARSIIGRCSWRKRLKQSLKNLDRAISRRSSKRLGEATSKIHNMFSKEPSQINNCLFTQLQSLTQLDMAQQLVTLYELLFTRLSPANPAASQQLDLFAKGVIALGSLEYHLTRSINSHHQFQHIDNRLRTIEILIVHGLEYLTLEWSDLKSTAQKLSNHHTDYWAKRLTELGSNLDQALPSKRADTLPKSQKSQIVILFRNYRTAVYQGFHQFDINLRDLLNQLEQVGGPLNAVLEMLA